MVQVLFSANMTIYDITSVIVGSNFPVISPATEEQLIWPTEDEGTTVKLHWTTVLRDHWHERPPVLKDHIFLAEVQTF